MGRGNKGDVESAGANNHNHPNDDQLYPMMLETPQLRWAFIRKVYVILCMQMLLTTAVAATVVFFRPIPDFLVHTRAGLPVYIVICILPFIRNFLYIILTCPLFFFSFFFFSYFRKLVVGFGAFFLTLSCTCLLYIVLCPLYCYHKRHPLNTFLLMLFTISIALIIGLACAFTKGKIILEAAILTSVVVVSLTLYTFWAVKRGHDFSFLGPFLFASLLMLICFGLIQIFFPLGKITTAIYSGLAALLFCGYIVYDTNNLIKRFSYDDYVWASVSLYLDIINLFLSLLTLLGIADS
ncbi:BI1-like protein [Morella rubra]|uniref:BI1-like protein n=1 Tax=Morella rubra TaxID=262757 RepID=A0A6A1VYU8_9ROSI|nr:BI1-like protein [Morella rubra]